MLCCVLAEFVEIFENVSAIKTGKPVRLLPLNGVTFEHSRMVPALIMCASFSEMNTRRGLVDKRRLSWSSMSFNMFFVGF